MISYELPMALALATPLLLLKYAQPAEIVDKQGGYYFDVLPRWTIFKAGGLGRSSHRDLCIAALAEPTVSIRIFREAEKTSCWRAFHTEYSSMSSRCSSW